MPIFKNIAQIAKLIRISAATDNMNVPRMQEIAEREYLLPVLGTELMQAVQTLADASPTEPTGLLKEVMQALAFLAYYKELPFLHTVITDSSLRNVTNEKIQGAYRYQYEDLKQHLENEGLAALERLFIYLMENKDEYAQWVISDAYKRLNKNLIKTGAEFAGYYTIFQPNRTFYALQPVLQEVEDLYIIPSIGTAFFNDLKDKEAPSDEEKEVLKMLCKAAANLTIHKCITKLSITIKPEGLTVMLSAGAERAQQGETNASAREKEELRQDTFRDGNSYLTSALEYLNANASDEVFPLFFESGLYKNPSTEVEDVNCKMNGVFSF